VPPSPRTGGGHCSLLPQRLQPWRPPAAVEAVVKMESAPWQRKSPLQLLAAFWASSGTSRLAAGGRPERPIIPYQAPLVCWQIDQPASSSRRSRSLWPLGATQRSRRKIGRAAQRSPSWLIAASACNSLGPLHRFARRLRLPGLIKRRHSGPLPARRLTNSP